MVKNPLRNDGVKDAEENLEMTIKEKTNENFCKAIDGIVVPLKDSPSACLRINDGEGRPVKIPLENITPDIKREIEKRTGKEVAR